MLVIPKAGAVGYAAKGVAGAVTRNLRVRHGRLVVRIKIVVILTGSIPGSKRFRKSTKS